MNKESICLCFDRCFEAIEQTFGDYTCQWPSDLESSLLTYVERHGVFHLIQVGLNNDAATIIVTIPFYRYSVDVGPRW